MQETFSRVQAEYLAEKSRMVKVLESHEDIEASTRDVEEVCKIPCVYTFVRGETYMYMYVEPYVNYEWVKVSLCLYVWDWRLVNL